MAALAARGACPVTGNGDLYGLGIRLGLYIQMLTVQLSGLLSAAVGAEDHIGQGTIVFVLSTLVVLVRLVATSIAGGGGGADPPVEPVEVFPVLTLLLVQLGVCRVSSHNTMTALIWMVELVGLGALYNYFWWRGMDLLPRSCADDKAFFFAKVSIWGWFRSLNKASAVVAATAAAVVLTTSCVAALFSAIRFLRGRSGAAPAAADTGQPAGQRGAALPAVDLLANVGAVVYVEVALRWNGITGVHSLDSPGQFMPFVIALGQLLSVLYSAAKYRLLLHADEHALDREEGSMLECQHDAKGWHGGGRDDEDIML